MAIPGTDTDTSLGRPLIVTFLASDKSTVILATLAPVVELDVELLVVLVEEALVELIVALDVEVTLEVEEALVDVEEVNPPEVLVTLLEEDA